MSVAKNIWNSTSTAVSGISQTVIYLFVAVLAIDIGSALNGMFIQSRFIRTALTDTLQITNNEINQYVAFAEAIIALAYYASCLVQLLDACLFCKKTKMQKSLATISSRGTIMCLLFWIIHVGLGREDEIATDVPLVAKDMIVGCNMAMTAFGAQGLWGIYHGTNTPAATASINAVLITPIITSVTSLAAEPLNEIHEFMGPAAGA
jgi:hypothetical protein